MINQFVDLNPISFELLNLITRSSGMCISIYLPGYRKGAGAPRSDVQLRSLIDLAEEKLRVRGVSDIDIDDLLRPVLALSREEAMQKGHAMPLAIFRAPNRLDVCTLPAPVDASVHVEASFHVFPVLRQLACPMDFRVLALTRKSIRLLQGTAAGTSPMALPASIPPTLADFLAFDQPDHRLANRTAAGPSVGAMKGISFGTGSEAEAQNDHFRDYCLAIDRGLRAGMGPKPQPLVLMGATAEVSIYQSIAQYPYMTEPVLRSPDDGVLTDEEVDDRVRAMLARTPSPDEIRAAAHVRKTLGSKLAVADLPGILRFAHKGRVDTVFLSADGAQYENIDHITGQVRLSGEFQAIDDDLFNAAAVETLRHSGAVWVVPPERIPGGGLSVAQLRY